MTETSPDARLEAFSDGVFSVALTLLITGIAIPATAEINNNADFWRALEQILPSFFAFLLSFGIVLITWVNHHSALKLIYRTSLPFAYANGLLLLGVVFIPFPTSLLGEHLFTDHSSPAVVLYSGVCSLQGIGWFFLTRTALNPSDLLTRDEQSTLAMRNNHRYSYFAIALYTACGIAALWLPQAIAIVITLIWLFWLLWPVAWKAGR